MPLSRAHNWTLFPQAKVSFNIFIIFKASFILSLAALSRTSTILYTLGTLERKFHEMLKTLIIWGIKDPCSALLEQDLGRVGAIFQVQQASFHSAVSDEWLSFYCLLILSKGARLIQVKCNALKAEDVGASRVPTTYHCFSKGESCCRNINVNRKYSATFHILISLKNK